MFFEVENAKAIMGAAFIQYMIYGVLYVMEGTRYIEFYEEPKTKAPSTA